jgi:hypothetical protein
MKQKNKLVRTHERVFSEAVDACVRMKLERKRVNVSKKPNPEKETTKA